MYAITFLIDNFILEVPNPLPEDLEYLKLENTGITEASSESNLSSNCNNF